MIVGEWQVGQVFLSMLWFALFFLWIYLLVVVFSDIFRSHDLGGFAKFLWVLFVIVLPYLGVFVYLIARGHKMSEHAAEAAAAGTASIVTDRCGVADSLRDRGALVIPYDEQALQAALARLLGDERLRSELGRGGREVAAELSWSSVARLQAEIYERVV